MRKKNIGISLIVLGVIIFIYQVYTIAVLAISYIKSKESIEINMSDNIMDNKDTQTSMEEVRNRIEKAKLEIDSIRKTINISTEEGEDRLLEIEKYDSIYKEQLAKINENDSLLKEKYLKIKEQDAEIKTQTKLIFFVKILSNGVTTIFILISVVITIVGYKLYRKGSKV